MRILNGPKLQFRQLLFSPDGRHLAGVGWSPSGGHAALVWAVHGNGDPLYELTSSDRRPYLSELVFSPNSSRVLVNHDTAWNGRILDSGEEFMDSELSAFRPRVVSENGKWAIRHERSEHDPGEVRVVAMANDEDRWRIAWTRFVRFATAQEITAHAEGTRGFAGGRLSSSGNRLALLYDSDGQDVGSCAVTVRVIDTSTGADVYEWRGELSDSAFLKLVGPQNHIVMHDGRQPSFHVIDIGSPNTPPLTRASTSRMPFTGAAFSPDGKLLATTSNDTTVTLWDTATWQPIRQYGWEIGRLRAVAFAPDGLTCAAGSDTGKVVLFDVDG